MEMLELFMRTVTGTAGLVGKDNCESFSQALQESRTNNEAGKSSHMGPGLGNAKDKRAAAVGGALCSTDLFKTPR